MDESKSGRALNSAEKAEADAPTNKQWLDTIARREAADDCPIPMTVGIVLLPISGRWRIIGIMKDGINQCGGFRHRVR